MSLRTSPWPAGVPCWADLSTPDVEAALAFYGAVLGWTSSGAQEEFGGYAIAERKGAQAAGIGPQTDGAPVAWTMYFASDDADASAAAVAAHGGSVLVQPGDVGPLGRMFIAADPSGAAFGVWQAGEHIGAGIVNEPGGLNWEDLRSTDPDAARAFYVGVFGLDTRPLDMASPDYTTFHLAGDEAPLGGMGGMMGQEGMPSHWSIYFGVESASEACSAAEAGGGSVLAPAFETPFGQMAALADPAGAAFMVVESAGSQQPERGL